MKLFLRQKKAVAGYFGGRIDATLDLLTNAVLVIPNIPLLILLASFAGTVGPLDCLPGKAADATVGVARGDDEHRRVRVALRPGGDRRTDTDRV